MIYTDRVLKHPEFLRIMNRIKEQETERIYCHHELEHALDVARIAWILFLEEVVEAQTEVLARRDRMLLKDELYVCALLHDIGRSAQYETGIHHSETGLIIAKEILTDVQCPQEWVDEILNVLAGHHGRSKKTKASEMDLGYYIGKADHDCRLCFFCEAKDSCKWGLEDRNTTVEW